MTATIDFTQATTTAPLGGHTAPGPAGRSAAPGVELLDLLTDRVAAIAFDDPDEFHSWRAGGRELLELAATARRATAYLGAYAGTVMTQAPGVVVVRELVAANRALAAAVALTSRA